MRLVCCVRPLCVGSAGNGDALFESAGAYAGAGALVLGARLTGVISGVIGQMYFCVYNVIGG